MGIKTKRLVEFIVVLTLTTVSEGKYERPMLAVEDSIKKIEDSLEDETTDLLEKLIKAWLQSP